MNKKYCSKSLSYGGYKNSMQNLHSMNDLKKLNSIVEVDKYDDQNDDKLKYIDDMDVSNDKEEQNEHFYMSPSSKNIYDYKNYKYNASHCMDLDDDDQLDGCFGVDFDDDYFDNCDYEDWCSDDFY